MATSEPGTQIPGLTMYSYNQAFENILVKIIHASDLLALTVEDTIDYASQAK